LPDAAADRGSLASPDPGRLGLAVLTERLATRRLRYAGLLGQRLRAAFANVVVLQHRRQPWPEAFGGHYGVTRSLVYGLRGLGGCSDAPSWAYQADLTRTPAEAAIVLSGVDVLRRTIGDKCQGRCRRLLAGPNLVILPDQHDGVLLSKAIDTVLVPSGWVRTMYEERSPTLEGRIRIWAAGVDTSFWQPYGSEPRRLVLIYNKLGRRRAEAVRAFLSRRGYPTALISYGRYSPIRYRRLLNASAAMVFLTESESQGLALAEAWAMNVPTFVIDNRRRMIGGRPVQVSTAPYLTAATGRFWKDPEELACHLDASMLGEFAPRTWVLANMSDLLCARQLLALALPQGAPGGASPVRWI
jgi:hypothetical protein